MSRVRLTQRSKRAADMSIPYPGNVNQPDRKDPSWEQYHTFEQTVNHELPDMRHDWQNDERDDIGFGISEPWGESPKVPTVASVRVAANKAVRIAVLLLGEKVDDDVVEAQARDLMSLSQSAMDRTLARFSESQSLYAEEDADEKEDEKKAEDKVEEKEDEKKADDKEDDKAEDKKEDEKEAKSKSSAEEGEVEPGAEKDEKKASAELAEKADKAKKAEDKAEDKKEDEKKAEDKVEDKKEDKKEDEKKADEKEDEEEEVVAKKASSNEMDIELNAATDEDEEEVTPETAAQLASLFDDGVTATEDVGRKADVSKKAGIKKLGGQPRVASTQGDGSTDISSIWETAPDVSEVFK